MTLHNRKPLNRMSEKKLASLGGRAFSTMARVAMKKKAPSEARVAQSMGSRARRKWINAKPCAGCGLVGYSENAHVDKDERKGLGIKAGPRCIAPMCGPLGNNCHRKYDQHEAPYDTEVTRVIVKTRAAIVAKEWDALEAANAKGRP